MALYSNRHCAAWGGPSRHSDNGNGGWSCRSRDLDIRPSSDWPLVGAPAMDVRDRRSPPQCDCGPHARVVAGKDAFCREGVRHVRLGAAHRWACDHSAIPVDSDFRVVGMRASNKITGVNAGGSPQLPMRTRWAARVASRIFRIAHD